MFITFNNLSMSGDSKLVLPRRKKKKKIEKERDRNSVVVTVSAY